MFDRSREHSMYISIDAGTIRMSIRRTSLDKLKVNVAMSLRSYRTHFLSAASSRTYGSEATSSMFTSAISRSAPCVPLSISELILARLWAKAVTGGGVGQWGRRRTDLVRYRYIYARAYRTIFFS